VLRGTNTNLWKLLKNVVRKRKQNLIQDKDKTIKMAAFSRMMMYHPVANVVHTQEIIVRVKVAWIKWIN
jgi:hypothetical protein